MQPYPPLQTLLGAALLRANGVDVAFFDATFDRGFASALDRLRPDVVAVCEDNFNFLTKMCLEPNRRLALEIAQAAQARGIRSIVNSSDAADHPGVYLNGGFHLVIQGELESSLVEAVAQPAAGVRPPRPPLSDLDRLPFPAWDLLDFQPYRRAWKQAHGYFSVNLAASRGCPYRCNWCAKPIHGSRYRAYSPARVAAEMERLIALCAPDQIWFADDIFALSAAWASEFAECVERRNVRVPFRIQSRCDLMTRRAVEALRRAGCVEVWMGAESGSQRVLDAMDKGIRLSQIEEARGNLRRHGIRACLFLQFGYLGEDWQDIQATIRMVRRLQPDDIGVSVSYPMPNTRFHEIVRGQIGSKANWSDSGELAKMFQSQQPAEFYRALAHALHLEVRKTGSSRDLRHAWEKVERLRAQPQAASNRPLGAPCSF